MKVATPNLLLRATTASRGGAAAADPSAEEGEKVPRYPQYM
jgi:hypothetical protein